MFKISKKRGSLLFSGLLLLGQGVWAILKNPELVLHHVKLAQNFNMGFRGPKYEVVAAALAVFMKTLKKFQSITGHTAVPENEGVSKAVNYISASKCDGSCNIVNAANVSQCARVLMSNKTLKKTATAFCRRVQKFRSGRRVRKQ